MGVSTDTIFRPKTKKEVKDHKARVDNQRKKKKKVSKQLNKRYGTNYWMCSNCVNKIRMKEPIGEKKILCTKCNEGFFRNSTK